MGILQTAYRTYQMLSQTEDIFDYRDDGTEPLTPVSHILQNAQIEITLTGEGKFLSAVPVSKGDESTIIPATEESAGRTSRPEPHPLCDQLAYLAPSDDKKHEAYLALLAAWAESPYSHPLVRAVLTYVRSGTILSDLERERIIVRNADGSLGSGKLAGTDYAKCLVRWRMIPAPDEEKSESYRNPALFEKWASFYNDLRVGQPHGICQISGEEDVLCQSHPKGTLSSAYGAKLISANDSANFTYRGRFATPEAAASVGYTASRMAHSALRWLATNHGKQSGDRIFLCWNPEGKETPGNLLYAFDAGEDKRDFVSYREELRKTLDGYGNKLRQQDDVVIAALEAATTGRLSVTYYTEMKSADLLDRIEHWYDTCAWDGGKFNVPTPSFREIILCAFGKPSGNGLSLDKRDAKLAGKYFQKLLSCLTEGRSIPPDLVRALAARADTPQAYEAGPLARIRHTACALIRKYRNDQAKREEWKVTLDTENRDRSYLFGRLLAVLEQAEAATYGKEDRRETNALRRLTRYTQQPMHTARALYEKLTPYLNRLMRNKPGLYRQYRALFDQLFGLLDELEHTSLNEPLEDVYLLGYSSQRSALFTKQEQNETNTDGGNTDE
ncbi:MAG: type I-C CRISPR-associated protein Cas8c/Csd1 [Clostridiales bacterium]|nr:MAG: type I-C CRISPR-associated protein Cas8c/Csd1 [Clostridiales bacterium]